MRCQSAPVHTITDRASSHRTPPAEAFHSGTFPARPGSSPLQLDGPCRSCASTQIRDCRSLTELAMPRPSTTRTASTIRAVPALPCPFQTVRCKTHLAKRFHSCASNPYPTISFQSLLGPTSPRLPCQSGPVLGPPLPNSTHHSKPHLAKCHTQAPASTGCRLLERRG